MARHATWVRRPEDPRTPQGWVLWHDLYVPPARRRTLLLAALGAVVAFGLSFALPFPAPILVGLFGLAGVAVVARPGAREHAEMPTLGEHEVFPVTLELKGPRRKGRGRRFLGRERGWIAFADGWLVYEGLRTSFALDAPSTERARRRMWEIRLDLPGGGRARFILLTDGLQTGRPATWHDRKRLASAFEAWQGHPPWRGEPVMPPHEPHPSVLVDVLRGELILGTLSAIAGVVGLAVGWAWMAVAGLVGFLVCAVAYRRGCRKLARQLVRANRGAEIFHS